MVVPKFLCFVEVKFANCHAEPWRHFALSRPSLSLSGKFVPTDATVINFRLDAAAAAAAAAALRSIYLSPSPSPPPRFLRWQQNREQQRGKKIPRMEEEEVKSEGKQ